MKTNAQDYAAAIGELRINVPLRWKIAHKIRGLRRLFSPVDDFDWNKYNVHYRSEIEVSSRYFTNDLRRVDFKFTDGNLYILGDCMPLHPTVRCVFETICNLPGFGSVAEIGVGAGYYLVGLRKLLGPEIRLSAYDISLQQLEFFKELYPEESKEVRSEVLDLTLNSIAENNRPDIVFASTVLMHIQRADAYRAALRNFLASGKRFVVLMDNWNAHDYMADLALLINGSPALGQCRLYCYDSGSNVAIVISKSVDLSEPYHALTDKILKKYL